MPELPEVETIVRELSSHLPGRSFGGVEVFHPDLLDESSVSFQARIAGREITHVGRRGKNIVLSLSEPGILVVNLGMTGRLLYLDAGTDTVHLTHLALYFSLSPEGSLLYADSRRFGRLRVLTPLAWAAESEQLGPEPLGPALTPGRFHGALQASRAPIRSWLLDQRRIAGIGNIYAAEALFRAGVHPFRQARTLTTPESKRLLQGIREVLREAIRAQGTTLRDYRTASGAEGEFGQALKVYGREGKPCPTCKTPVERIVFGNRSAFLCPVCQPNPF
jgi:formamidopyrimidine-DNA glycosylase